MARRNPIQAMLKEQRRTMSIMTTGKAPRERVPAKVKNQVKDRVKKKYGRLVCEVCKKKPRGVTLQYHHKNMKNTDNRPNNIQLLCPNHHSLKHKKKYRKQYRDITGRVRATRLVRKKSKKKKTRKRRQRRSSSLFTAPKIKVPTFRI